MEYILNKSELENAVDYSLSYISGAVESLGLEEAQIDGLEHWVYSSMFELFTTPKHSAVLGEGFNIDSAIGALISESKEYRASRSVTASFGYLSNIITLPQILAGYVTKYVLENELDKFSKETGLTVSENWLAM